MQSHVMRRTAKEGIGLRNEGQDCKASTVSARLDLPRCFVRKQHRNASKARLKTTNPQGMQASRPVRAAALRCAVLRCNKHIRVWRCVMRRTHEQLVCSHQ
jgi:hypothetical protein